MKNNKILLITVLVFSLVLSGAYILYHKLGQELAPDQLAVHEQVIQEPSATKTASSQEVSEDSGSASEDQTSNDSSAASEQEPALTPAPDFTVFDKDGNEVKLSSYIGKPIVLNFWASWCGPCQMEMPDFQEKYLELGENVHFLMINMTDGSRETVDTASEFIEEKGYTFPVFFDKDGNASITYGAYSLPTSYFINAEGYVVAQATGAIDGATLQRGIDMIYS